MRASARGLEARRLDELAALRRTADANGDFDCLLAWLFRNSGYPRPRADQFRRLRALLVVLNSLKHRFVPPFDQFQTVPVPPLERPNWENVPQELVFLASAAERFAALSWSSETIAAALAELDEDQLAELDALAARIRREGLVGHPDAPFNKWISSRTQTRAEELLLDCLFEMLDESVPDSPFFLDPNAANEGP